MLVPVSLVDRVAMVVVHVIGVVAVCHCFVAAFGSVLVIVIRVGHVGARLALVPVAFVVSVSVSVVEIIGVVAVRDRNVAAVGSVRVVVVGMGVMNRGHLGAPLLMDRVGNELYAQLRFRV